MSGITFNTSYKKLPQKKVILYNVPKFTQQVLVPVQAPVQVPVQAPVQVPVQAPVQASVQAPVQASVQASVIKKSVDLSNSNISVTDRIKKQYLKKNIIT